MMNLNILACGKHDASAFRSQTTARVTTFNTPVLGLSKISSSGFAIRLATWMSCSVTAQYI